MGVMDFEPESKRMRLISVRPSFSFDDIQENCGFDLLRSEKIVEIVAPTRQELDFLRNEVDPCRYGIGRV